MPVVHTDSHLVTVFANTSGSISIQQITVEHGAESIVCIDADDIHDLIHALESVAQEITDARSNPAQ